MPAVQPTSARSQHSWLQLPSALNCPWNLKSDLNNPLTEDLRFKFLFVLLCAAPTTVVFVVKLKVKVQFTLEQATKAQKWSKGIALLFL
jgi:hypothetical protein